ncbi:molybdate ABC transporter substrate-binding protein [Halobacillus salinus]|uniref:molybdate ABC transporter substrate-binding protein n=1 Tax=Halobacillus salinus TaxID=192814 RepID=UPI001116906D|nr:molybdate ABC transporter substrate-binding protein [Halobacillus salinus]
MLKRLTPWFFVLLLLVSCSNEQEKEQTLTISAAASLTDAIEEITDIYEQSHNLSITLNIAGSGRLAQQIEQGAPADVFLSANQKWMDELENKTVIDPSTRINFVNNRLVVISNKGTDPLPSIQSITQLEKNEQIALGLPGSVPAGTYTKQGLESIHLWDDLEEKMVFGNDVRQVLAYVESGNVTYGFVYGSDAASSEKVSIVSELEDDSHDAIVYPAAVVKASDHPDSARDFVDFLRSEEAQNIFSDYGFKPVEEREG